MENMCDHMASININTASKFFEILTELLNISILSVHTTMKILILYLSLLLLLLGLTMFFFTEIEAMIDAKNIKNLIQQLQNIKSLLNQHMISNVHQQPNNPIILNITFMLVFWHRPDKFLLMVESYLIWPSMVLDPWLAT